MQSTHRPWYRPGAQSARRVVWCSCNVPQSFTWREIMLGKLWRQALNLLVPSPRNPALGRRCRPQVEVLEDRLAPATVTWNALSVNPFAADSKWSNANCWADGRVPQNGDDVVFPGYVSLLMNHFTVNDLNNLTVRSITVTDFYAIEGNALNLGAGGIRTISSASEGPGVIMNAGLNLTSAAFPTVINTDVGTSVSLFSTVSGVGGLTKVGAGVLHLTGENSFTGRTTVDGGTLILRTLEGGYGNASTLGATGAGNETFVSSGAVLELKTSVFNETLHLGGALQCPVDNFSGASTFTWTGPIVLDGSLAYLSIASGASLTVTGDINN